MWFLYFVDFSIYRNVYIRSYTVTSESILAHILTGTALKNNDRRSEEITEVQVLEMPQYRFN